MLETILKNIEALQTKHAAEWLLCECELSALKDQAVEIANTNEFSKKDADIIVFSENDVIENSAIELYSDLWCSIRDIQHDIVNLKD